MLEELKMLLDDLERQGVIFSTEDDFGVWGWRVEGSLWSKRLDLERARQHERTNELLEGIYEVLSTFPRAQV